MYLRVRDNENLYFLIFPIYSFFSNIQIYVQFSILYILLVILENKIIYPFSIYHFLLQISEKHNLMYHFYTVLGTQLLHQPALFSFLWVFLYEGDMLPLPQLLMMMIFEKKSFIRWWCDYTYVYT